MNELKGATTRLARLGLFFVAAFAVLSGLLVYWQVVRAGELTNRPDNPRLYAELLTVHRGDIEDRRGTAVVHTTFVDGAPHRVVYDPSLSLLIGYHSKQYDNTGLEAIYNDYLNGAAASQPIDNVVRRLMHEPVLGDTVQLTIDDRIQQIANDALGNGNGVALVADPRNGQILAIVSKPGFDATRIDEPGYWASLQTGESRLLNRALYGLYPPGSTFKTVTLATALARGTYTLNSVFRGEEATGPLYVGGALLHSNISNLPQGVTEVTLKEAFKYSDNITFAVIGRHLGVQALLDGANTFGFDQAIPFDLPVSTSSVTKDLNNFNEFDLATSAFGQATVQVTPLQLLLVDEAIANGGALMQPYVVKRILAPNGEALVDNQPQLWRQALTPEVAQQVGQAMLSAVEDPGASGYAVRLPNVPIAGKTGTAQVGQPGVQPHAWFMCYAPADHPKLAVVVLKENAGEGSQVAAPIARLILEKALRLYH